MFCSDHHGTSRRADVRRGRSKFERFYGALPSVVLGLTLTMPAETGGKSQPFAGPGRGRLHRGDHRQLVEGGYR